MKLYQYTTALFYFILVNASITRAQNIIGIKKANPDLLSKIVFSGKITDAKTGNPLAGSSVFIADLKTGAIANNDGIYLINNIAPGRHLVEVSFVGYATYTEYIEFTIDTKKDFALSESILENNEVIVTGVSTATQIHRTPTPVSIIKRQELIKITSSNLIDAISRKPGIAQVSTGPVISKPVIRGLGYNRVIVMNDGVRQEGQQWGDEHGIEIDEYSVNKIEILKGPASLMYGSDAMAGVINILTNTPAAVGTYKGSIIANYQSNNRLRGIGTIIGAYHKNGFNWNLYGTYKAAADYENKLDGRVYNSKFNELNAGGYIGFNGSWGYSHLVFSSFNQKTGIIEGERDSTGNFSKPLQGGGVGLPTANDFNTVTPQIPWQQINHKKLVSDNNFNIGNGRFSLILGYQNNQRKEFGNIDDPTEKELFFDLHTGTYSAVYHIKENNNWRTSIGVNGMLQANKNKGATALIPNYTLFDVGGFIFTQKTAKRFTVSGGIRFDHRSLHAKSYFDGTSLKFIDFKKNVANFSGSAGISYQASKKAILKFNIARGFRAPSIPELGSNGTHEGTNRYEYGDQNLKSETSFQLDGGIEWNTEHISFTASVFYNSINNFIFYSKLAAMGGGDSTVFVDGNNISAFKFSQGNAVIYGAEFTIDIHPHPFDWLHFENGISIVNGRFKKAIDGSRNIPFIPAARLLSDLRADLLSKGKLFRNAYIKIELEKIIEQKHPFTAFNTETKTPGYALINAGIGTDIITKKDKTVFSLYINVLNIGDVAYQNHLSRLKYTQENLVTGRTGVFNMGRNVSIKLNIPIAGSFTK